jgi:hypothetical protein
MKKVYQMKKNLSQNVHSLCFGETFRDNNLKLSWTGTVTQKFVIDRDLETKRLRKTALTDNENASSIFFRRKTIFQKGKGGFNLNLNIDR